jgi:hypothetical protein
MTKTENNAKQENLNKEKVDKNLHYAFIGGVLT